MTSFVSNLKTNLIVHTLFYSILGIVGAQAQEMNGFDLSKATIPNKEIHSGGPGRDGIPSIDAPKFIAAAQVDFLRDDDSVVSLSRGGKSRAYPLRILVWHEIVNDKFGGDEIAVTYCPLCGTAMVFNRKIAGKVRTFGVSGLLYQSDVLMFDREKESLWSQLKMQAVSGGDAGSDLTWLPSEQMSWKAWRAKNPDGEVLSTATGHRRNYGLNDTPKIAALLLIVGPLKGFGSLLIVAVAMALGGLFNARRVADTMSHKLTDMNPGQGFAANLSTALLVTTASLHGMPVSTTHVSVGALLGMGTVTRQAKWRTIRPVLASWIITLPVASAIAAITYFISQYFIA